MRWIYVLLTYLLAPLIIAHDAWQALRSRDYRGRIGQRLGFVPAAARANTVWIHAVSVGEVQAAAALVAELRRRAADMPITVTTVTPTGAQRARALIGGADGISHLLGRGAGEDIADRTSIEQAGPDMPPPPKTRAAAEERRQAQDGRACTQVCWQRTMRPWQWPCRCVGKAKHFAQ